ncbi:MAG: response regulator [Deltaproteobacteria bacterium]|nr:response regulator [Deltaproteobacteria bacterium]
MFRIIEHEEKSNGFNGVNNLGRECDSYTGLKIKNMDALHPKRIMVVDDDPIVRDILECLLSYLSFKAVTIDNAYDALDLFTNGNFDLVLTDIQMPGMDGWELTCRIKKASSETPVILMTGLNKFDVEEGMKNSPADSILFKPFNIRDLAKIVNEILNNNHD